MTFESEYCTDNCMPTTPEIENHYSDAVEVCGILTADPEKDEISMDPKKVMSSKQWPTPKKVKEIQVFLAFANFYRKFIQNYALLTQPLTNLLKKDSPLIWDEREKTVLTKIKYAFETQVFLSHPDEKKEFLVECDASDFALGGVLSQFGPNNELQPVVFFSCQMCPAERNHEIYDKELLVIIECLKEWRYFLQNSVVPFTIFTGHKNLQYFMTTKQLTRRQARWSLFLSEFDFKLAYRSGPHNGKADLLSRRPDYYITQESHNLIQVFQPSYGISGSGHYKNPL
ncbi:hypothetical protein BASA81_017423 [Batrachochytrium salamandrivorans]|nr:hypothetical protein BASA81_017423 [Batrachochytrium salamandrivorans]